MLKISSILWGLWGIVHIMAGVFTVSKISSGNISGAVGGIADAVDLSTLQMNYPDAAGAILSQHGFNLLWIGIVTFVCAFYVWNGNRTSILLAALVGGLADIGYFIFMDLGGYVHFVPGTLMTIFSALAILLSFWAIFKK